MQRRKRFHIFKRLKMEFSTVAECVIWKIIINGWKIIANNLVKIESNENRTTYISDWFDFGKWVDEKLIEPSNSKAWQSESFLGPIYSKLKDFVDSHMITDMSWVKLHLDQWRLQSYCNLSDPKQKEGTALFWNIHSLLSKINLIKEVQYNKHNLALHREGIFFFHYFANF